MLFLFFLILKKSRKDSKIRYDNDIILLTIINLTPAHFHRERIRNVHNINHLGLELNTTDQSVQTKFLITNT